MLRVLNSFYSFSSSDTHEVGIIILLILQMRKLRHS